MALVTVLKKKLYQHQSQLFCGSQEGQNITGIQEIWSWFKIKIIPPLVLLIYWVKIKKWTNHWTLSTLNYFRSKIFFFSIQFNSIWFNSIRFYFVKFQNRPCVGTLSTLNHFRSKSLFSPWSWVISNCLFLPWSRIILFSLFDYTFSYQFNSIQFNSIQISLIQFKYTQLFSVQFYFIFLHLFQNSVNIWIISDLSFFLHHCLRFTYIQHTA